MPDCGQLAIGENEGSAGQPSRETKRCQSVELCKRRGQFTELGSGLVPAILRSECQESDVRLEEMPSPLHLVPCRLQVVFPIVLLTG